MTLRTPGASTATGFSTNVCLPFFDRVGQMLRPEVGRSGKDHDVDVAVDDFLVGVEADEDVVVWHLDAIFDGVVAAQLADTV